MLPTPYTTTYMLGKLRRASGPAGGHHHIRFSSVHSILLKDTGLRDSPPTPPASLKREDGPAGGRGCVPAYDRAPLRNHLPKKTIAVPRLLARATGSAAGSYFLDPLPTATGYYAETGTGRDSGKMGKGTPTVTLLYPLLYPLLGVLDLIIPGMRGKS
jgi:hypothetical protein